MKELYLILICIFLIYFLAPRLFIPAVAIATIGIISMWKVSGSNAQKYPCRAVFIPHAGEMYSGYAAWSALNLVDFTNVNKIIMLSTSHYGLSGRFLASNKVPEVFKSEHSWQFVMPILESFISRDKIEIHLVNDNYKLSINKVDKNTLLICNSDITHLDADMLQNSKSRVDKIYFEDAKTINTLFNGPFGDANSYAETTCGIYAIAEFIRILRNIVFFEGVKIRPHLAMYYGSAQMHKVSNETFYKKWFADWRELFSRHRNERNVSYASICYFELPSSLFLTEYGRYYCKALAESAIFANFPEPGKLTRVAPEPNKYLQIPALRRRLGCFVTIYNMRASKKQLRGCIGTLSTAREFGKIIGEYAAASAFADPRFAPMSADELNFGNFEIEITLLEEKKRVSEAEYYANYRIGLDGIEIEYEGSSAYFLPSVGADLQSESGKNANEIKTQLVEMLFNKAGIKKKYKGGLDRLKYYINVGFSV